MIPLADWLPRRRSAREAIVVRADRDATLIVDGPFRVVVREGRRIDVARDRPRLAIDHWFSLGDDRWVFVTVDGLVLSSRGFTGPFETRAELPVAPRHADGNGVVGAATVQTLDGRWWVLDDAARPRALATTLSRQFFALRFFERDRAIALRVPGVVLLSSDGGRSWGQLRMNGDVPRALDGRSDGRVIVRGWRERWALDDRGVFGRVVREEPDADRNEEQGARAVARWRELARRSMPRVSGDFEAASIAGWLGDTHVVLVGSMLLAQRGSEPPVRRTVESASDCSLFPFGASLAVRCQRARPSARLRFIDVEPLAIRAVETPFELDRDVVFASDGSVVARYERGSRSLNVWTPDGGWRERALPEQIELLDAANGQVFGVSARGLVAVRLVGDPGAELRQVARFEVDGGAGYTTALASGAHGSLRAWVLSDAQREHCAVLLEDGSSASTIDMPRCEPVTSVLFLDRRFGVVSTEHSILVFRDGQRWQTLAREVVSSAGASTQLPRRGEPGWESTRLYALGDSIIVPPWQRVTRDGSERALTASVAPNYEPIFEPTIRAPEQTITCVARGERVARRDPTSTITLIHGLARLSIDDRADDSAVSLQWSFDGRARSQWRGPRPWRADPQARLSIACASDRGVVVEQCAESPTSPPCAQWLLREGGSDPVPLLVESPPAETEGQLAFCRWEADSWQLEFRDRFHVYPGFAQRQRRGADGALVERHDVVRLHASDVARVVRDGVWSWAEPALDDTLRVVSYEQRGERTLDAIETLRVCRGEDGDGERIFLPGAVYWSATLGSDSTILLAELRALDRGYCIESATDDPASVLRGASAQHALSVRASRDGQLRGTWTIQPPDRPVRRIDVECRLAPSSERE